MIKFKFLGFLITGLLLGGCATTKAPQGITPAGSLQDLCRQYEVTWQLDNVSQGVTLSRDGFTAKAMIGSDVVIVGDQKITLNAPIRRHRGVVIVPPDFENKILEQFAKRKDFSIKKFREIIIDPGHGGKDPGAMGKTGLKEKTVVLDIAKRLKEKLGTQGMNVSMTRDGDQFVALEERARMANKSSADLFISIHANANRARSVHGFEVYYLRNLTEKTRREIVEGTNYREMFKNLSMKQGDAALERALLDMLFANKQYESKKLAQYLAQNTPDNFDSPDRGSKSAGFFVLKNTLIPAVLVEVGFLSNKNEERLLGTPSYREEIAESLAKSILQYVSQQ